MGAGDLRHRPAQVHRVRRPLRRAAVRAGVPGGVHPGEPGSRRVARDAVGRSTGGCIGQRRKALPRRRATLKPGSSRWRGCSLVSPSAHSPARGPTLIAIAAALSPRRFSRCSALALPSRSASSASRFATSAASPAIGAARRRLGRRLAVTVPHGRLLNCRGRPARSGRSSAAAPPAPTPQSDEQRSRRSGFIVAVASPRRGSAGGFGRGGLACTFIIARSMSPASSSSSAPSERAMQSSIASRCSGGGFLQHVVDDFGLHAGVADAQAQPPEVAAAELRRGCPSARCGRRRCRRASASSGRAAGRARRAQRGSRAARS